MSQRAKATVLFSVAMYGALLFSVCSEPGFWVEAFGPAAFGWPTPTVVGIVVTLLYLPVPWFAWHATEIVLRGRDAGMSLGKPGILYLLLTAGRRFPELRRSQAVVAGGVCYFLALAVGWIYYASTHGL